MIHSNGQKGFWWEKSCGYVEAGKALAATKVRPQRLYDDNWWGKEEGYTHIHGTCLCGGWCLIQITLRCWIWRLLQILFCILSVFTKITWNLTHTKMCFTDCRILSVNITVTYEIDWPFIAAKLNVYRWAHFLLPCLVPSKRDRWHLTCSHDTSKPDMVMALTTGPYHLTVNSNNSNSQRTATENRERTNAKTVNERK